VAKKTKKGTEEGPLPSAVKGRAPEALLRAFETLLPPHEGQFAFALPYRKASDKRAVQFDAITAWEVMSSYGDSLPQTQTFVPLATVGKGASECFAVDPSSPELPVYYFEHEAGYHPFAPSLQAFLEGLLAKGDKTPFQKLEALLKKADVLAEKEKHADVVALLAPALEKMPAVRYGDEAASGVGRAFNCFGLALKSTGERDKAIRAFERARVVGNNDAPLNLVSLFEDEGNLAACVALADELRDNSYLGSDPYEWFWARNYLGRASLRLGDEVRALRCFNAIDVELGRVHTQYLNEARKGLELLAAEGGAPAPMAQQILSWLGQRPAPAPEAGAKARAWWVQLPEVVRAKLTSSKRLGSEPTDEILVDLTRTTSLDLKGCQIEELSFLSVFVRLQTLKLDDNPLRSLDSLPLLPKLTELSADGCQIAELKGLSQLPNLEDLGLRKNGLENLKGVEVLAQLRVLDVSDNQIRDLGPIASLLSLRKLQFRKTLAVDLSPLAACTLLQEIDLVGSDQIAKGLMTLVGLAHLKEITGVSWSVPKEESQAFMAARPDVDFDVEGYRRFGGRDTTDDDRAWWARFAQNPNLKEAIRKDRIDADEPVDDQLGKLRGEDHFSMAGEQITSLAEMAGFLELNFLDITRNPVVDLSPLQDLRKLKFLRADHTQVQDLTPLSRLTKLYELALSGTQVNTLLGLEDLALLSILKLDDTRVSSLSPLTGHSNLKTVSFSGAPVTGLEPLARHQGLSRLDCSASRIKDLSPLAACVRLARLECWGLEGATGLLALAELPELNLVCARSSFSAEELAEFRRRRPDVELR
jgi:Leucine-rich repeat (LRR) protein